MHDPHCAGWKVELKFYRPPHTLALGYWRSPHHHYFCLLIFAVRARVK